MQIKELLQRQQKNENTAIVCNNTVYSYKDLYEQALNLSILLKRYSTSDSGNIALFLPNSYEYVFSYFAITMVNKVVVPISIEAKRPEIISTVNYCDVDVVITNSNYFSEISECLSEINRPTLIIDTDLQEVYEPNGEYDPLIQRRADNWNEDLTDVAIMLHTSGTTSSPKRVMLTHSNLISNIESNITSLKLTSEDRVLVQLPMFFGYCNTAQLLTHIYLGAAIIVMDKLFTPNYFWRIVERERITNFTTVPSCLLLLLDSQAVPDVRYTSLRYICFGGGNMPVHKLRMLIERFPSIGFVQTYGQTEASPRISCLLPDQSLNKIGSVGKPIPNVTVKIIDENNNERGYGEIGEIIVKGSNVMKGYYKRKNETTNTIIDKWLHTGDLGKFDEDGFIYIVGRKKNMIISSGMNIYPEEIEEIIMDFTYTDKVIVFSEQDDLLGEVPVAKIKFKNTNSEQKSMEMLLEYCRKNLSKVKVPKKFYVVSEFEKTLTGKLKRS